MTTAMFFYWVAGGAPLVAAAVAAVWHPRWIMRAAIAAGLGVAAGMAARPTLFRAENGFALTFVVFGLATTVVAMAAGSVVHVLVRELGSRNAVARSISQRRRSNDR